MTARDVYVDPSALSRLYIHQAARGKWPSGEPGLAAH